MPTTVVHNYFAKDVYDKLKTPLQSNFDLNFLNITTQGPDIFYYYFSLSSKKTKAARALAAVMHRHKTGDFIVEMAKLIKEQKLMDNKMIMTYFYGTIMHMMLDSTIHPFIFYKTGIFNPKIKKTYKYNGGHTDMERFLDCYFIYTRDEILPHKAQIHKTINYTLDNSEFSDFLNTSIKNTYQYEDAYKTYVKGIRHIYLNHLYLRNDPYKWKHIVLKVLDGVIKNNWRKKSSYCYSIPFKQKYHYLNLEKSEWNHPALEYEFHKSSFIELYVCALEKATKLIEELDVYLTTNKDLRYLKKKLPNISYMNGKNTEEKLRMQYFEY